jgi:hypothetical protein
VNQLPACHDLPAAVGRNHRRRSVKVPKRSETFFLARIVRHSAERSSETGSMPGNLSLISYSSCLPGRRAEIDGVAPC